MMIRNVIRILSIIGLIAIPLILLFLPSTYFDEGDSLCLSQTLFNTECYGCGMTRASMHLIHGEFETASSFNKLSFVVVPLLGLLWLKLLLAQFGKKIFSWFY